MTHGQRCATRFGIILAVGALAACSNETPGATGQRPRGPSTLAVAASNPAAHGSLQGLVTGDRASGGGADPVSGVAVSVYQLALVAGGGPTDTAANQTPTLIGSLVSDGSGRFSLAAIPAGTFTVSLTPPAGSVYLPRDTWEFVSTGSNAQVDTIDMARR